jgi:hypothetical protein
MISACDDDDNDRLLDLVETNTGFFIDARDTRTNPLLADTDGDGLDDVCEVSGGSDPTDRPPKRSARDWSARGCIRGA